MEHSKQFPQTFILLSALFRKTRHFSKLAANLLASMALSWRTVVPISFLLKCIKISYFLISYPVHEDKLRALQKFPFNCVSSLETKHVHFLLQQYLIFTCFAKIRK
ncbi:hypothetical protein KP509_09G089800 [Ceratopteris richardii]|uniref:Uncharacterized protein n=1 Tax=Ceratopteris richardii TaxID=49495 RepID=A0A8T2U2A5_CERRI|nr:hypothetical protein KP509_09G089800 [Ceratopteris richardii]